jgi:hypothetical protein
MYLVPRTKISISFTSPGQSFKNKYRSWYFTTGKLAITSVQPLAIKLQLMMLIFIYHPSFYYLSGINRTILENLTLKEREREREREGGGDFKH